jgi:hypothetical protein
MQVKHRHAVSKVASTTFVNAPTPETNLLNEINETPQQD